MKLVGISETKRDYLKDSINELATNSKNKNIGDLYIRANKCKKGYQPITPSVTEKKGDLHADFRSILNRWKNYFFPLMNVRVVSDVRQNKIHT
jgi:hypothetical protein